MLLSLQEGSAGPAAVLEAAGGQVQGWCVEEAPSWSLEQEGQRFHSSHLDLDYLRFFFVSGPLSHPGDQLQRGSSGPVQPLPGSRRPVCVSASSSRSPASLFRLILSLDLLRRVWPLTARRPPAPRTSLRCCSRPQSPARR